MQSDTASAKDRRHSDTAGVVALSCREQVEGFNAVASGGPERVQREWLLYVSELRVLMLASFGRWSATWHAPLLPLEKSLAILLPANLHAPDGRDPIDRGGLRIESGDGCFGMGGNGTNLEV